MKHYVGLDVSQEEIDELAACEGMVLQGLHFRQYCCQ